MKNARLIVFLALVVLVSSGFVESEDIFSDSGKDVIVIRILDFESPAKLGDFFSFQYYLRDVSGVDDAVTVDFWIEKDGKEIAYGSDNFFLDASNRSVQSKIFLPSDLQSGIYTFNIKASHDEFSSTSYRTIEISVKNDLVFINLDNLKINLITVSLILLTILSASLIFYMEKDNLSRIFRFGEVLAFENAFFRRHRFPILFSNSIIIFGILIYYLDYTERLLPKFAFFMYFILLVLMVLLISRIISDMFLSDSSKNNISKKETRFKKMSNWLMEDVKFGKKNENNLKNLKKSKVTAEKIKKESNLTGFP